MIFGGKVSLTNMYRYWGNLLALVTITILFASQYVLAQDTNQTAPSVENNTGQESDPNQATETPDAGESTESQIAKPVNEARRYFLGDRPRLERQKGPALGAPKSILPKPYVPKGSIKLPPAEPGEGNTADTTPDGLKDDGKPSGTQTELLITNDNPLPSIADEDGTSLEVSPDGEQQRVEISESTLEAFDPSIVSVIGASSGFSANFWQGYSRQGYIDRLKDFSDTSGSSTLTELASKVALSGDGLPEADNDNQIDTTVRERLDLLASLGQVSSYVAFINRLPKDYDRTALSKEVAEAHLLSGEMTEACQIAEEQRKTDQSVYWLRLAAFCSAAQGNRVNVDFQLGILEEVQTLEPTFYSLIDYILFEAEQNAAGNKIDDEQIPPLNGPLEINILEGTMARLARVEVSEFKLENVNPLALDIMLANPSVTKDAKISLISMALQHGWINTENLSTFYRTYNASDDEKQSAFVLATTEPGWQVDATLSNIVASNDNLLKRADALEAAWRRAVQQKTASNISPALQALVEELSPDGSVNTRAAIFAKIALLAGDREKSAAWIRTLRTRSAGDDTDADRALVELWPTLIIGLEEDITQSQFNRWWQSNTDTSDRFERANLILSLAEASGNTVPDSLWQTLEDGPATLSGASASPAQWRRFLIAAENGDRPGALAAAFKLLAPLQSGEVSAAVAGSIVGTLRQLGFREEAHSIALEILISRGL